MAAAASVRLHRAAARPRRAGPDHVDVGVAAVAAARELAADLDADAVRVGAQHGEELRERYQSREEQADDSGADEPRG